jgi:hypothetical protein
MKSLALSIVLAITLALCAGCNSGVGVDTTDPRVAKPQFDKNKLVPKEGETKVQALKRAFGAGTAR